MIPIKLCGLKLPIINLTAVDKEGNLELFKKTLAR
jgi:hypothetical protein